LDQAGCTSAAVSAVLKSVQKNLVSTDLPLIVMQWKAKKKDAYLLCLQKSTGLYNPCLVRPFHFGPAYSLFLPNTSYLSGFFAALFSEVVSHSFLNFYQTARLWKGRNSLLVSLHFSAARGSSPSPHFSVFIPGGPPPNEGCFFGLNCLFGA